MSPTRFAQALGTNAELVPHGLDDAAQSLFRLLLLRFGADPILASIRQRLFGYALRSIGLRQSRLRRLQQHRAAWRRWRPPHRLVEQLMAMFGEQGRQRFQPP